MPTTRICLPLIALCMNLSACATPAARIDEQAARFGFTRTILPGTEFLHVVYLKKIPKHPVPMLHVYLEGDGSPWIWSTEVAADPTPHRPVMLELMSLDPAPSVYLGRPCYFGLSNRPPCSPRLWTQARYSEGVVLSLAAALGRLVEGSPPPAWVFLGHSGGGTLAMLLAERFGNTRAVITLAGNLDIEAWARFHGYTPLHASLNPASRPPLDARIIQRHYVGLRDGEVSPTVAQGFASQHPEAELIEVEEAGHVCCWRALWPEILQDLEKTLTAGDGRPAAPSAR